jgi:hypothetical protein
VHLHAVALVRPPTQQSPLLLGGARAEGAALGGGGGRRAILDAAATPTELRAAWAELDAGRPTADASIRTGSWSTLSRPRTRPPTNWPMSLTQRHRPLRPRHHPRRPEQLRDRPVTGAHPLHPGEPRRNPPIAP